MARTCRSFKWRRITWNYLLELNLNKSTFLFTPSKLSCTFVRYLLNSWHLKCEFREYDVFFRCFGKYFAKYIRILNTRIRIFKGIRIRILYTGINTYWILELSWEPQVPGYPQEQCQGTSLSHEYTVPSHGTPHWSSSSPGTLIDWLIDIFGVVYIFNVF